MPKFTDSDIEKINQSYKEILFNLRDYLKKFGSQNVLDGFKIMILMLHSGLFSMGGAIRFENDYDYLFLPTEMSLGVHVMYGVCCCRHTTAFFYDLLSTLGFQPSLMYLFIDHTTGNWYRVNSEYEQSNHVVILLECLGEQYIIDSRNQFLFRKGSHGALELLNIEFIGHLLDYRDANIETIGKTLKKYYTYQEFGIHHVYDYQYSDK